MTAPSQAVLADPSEDEVQKTPESRGMLLQARGVTVRTPAGVNLLSDISFHIEPGELIALTGLTYTQKSTLLQSLAGLMKPLSGEILIDGVELYANLKAFRSSIGFVPAQFAVPENLTVIEVLQDAARLRLPRRISSDDRMHRLASLLETVGLRQVLDRRAGVLSGVEKRKLSIAVELIGDPAILLVDESAQQLSPFDEMQITVLLRELSRQGVTIIQADQRARSAGLSNKIIFLGPGGCLGWFGPSDEAFAYLRGFLPKGIARDLFSLKEALEILANPQPDQGIEWAKRFRAHEAYQKYVDDPLQNRYPDLLLQTSPLLRLRSRNSSKENLPPTVVPGANFAQKLILLIKRNFRSLRRDKAGLATLAIPPLAALADFVLSSSTQSDPSRTPIVSGVLVFLILLTAALLGQNEIFKERAVYQREARNTSLVLPYILSKACLVGILAIYQGLVWSTIHFIATGAAGGIQTFALYGVTFILVAFVGGLLGLVASALSRTPLTITSLVLLLTIPQLLLNGSTVPLADLSLPLRVLSGLNPSRYAVEVVLAANVQGAGLGATPWGHWSAVAMLSLGLMLLLLAIQQRAGTAAG